MGYTQPVDRRLHFHRAWFPLVLLTRMLGIGIYLLYPQIRGAHTAGGYPGPHRHHRRGYRGDQPSPKPERSTVANRPIGPVAAGGPRVASLIARRPQQWPGLRVFLRRARLRKPVGGPAIFAGLKDYKRTAHVCRPSRGATRRAGQFPCWWLAPITPDCWTMTSGLGPIQFTLWQPPRPRRGGSRFGIDGRLYVPGER